MLFFQKGKTNERSHNNAYKHFSSKNFMDNYSSLIERISKSSQITKEEIERKIEAKRAKLSGLISKEGAAQIVASELGINLDKERLKISELLEGMRKTNVLGKVIQISPVRSFSKNGREGKVASLVLADETSNTRVVLWDTNHISLIEKNKIKEKDVIEISNAGVRNSELHLSSFSDIKLSKERIEEVVTEKPFNEKKLKDIKPGENIKTRAVIVQTFEPRYFEVCPQCGKKIVEEECKLHGKITPEKRAILNIILDDGTETIRTVLFGEQINKLGLENNEIFSIEEYSKAKERLLGEEKIFTGLVKNNTLYNTIEFSIENIENPNPESLIKELESRI